MFESEAKIEGTGVVANKNVANHLWFAEGGWKKDKIFLGFMVV